MWICASTKFESQYVSIFIFIILYLKDKKIFAIPLFSVIPGRCMWSQGIRVQPTNLVPRVLSYPPSLALQGGLERTLGTRFLANRFQEITFICPFCVCLSSLPCMAGGERGNGRGNLGARECIGRFPFSLVRPNCPLPLPLLTPATQASV